MSVFGSLGREHKRQQFIREDYGFAMSYPLGWAVHIPVVGVTGTEFILAPDQAPSVYDAVLGREVLNPFVNIVISEWSDPTENIVDTFAEQRPVDTRGTGSLEDTTAMSGAHAMSWRTSSSLDLARILLLPCLCWYKRKRGCSS